LYFDCRGCGAALALVRGNEDEDASCPDAVCSTFYFFFLSDLLQTFSFRSGFASPFDGFVLIVIMSPPWEYMQEPGGEVGIDPHQHEFVQRVTGRGRSDKRTRPS
jgi:hypothetical protein